MSKVPLTVNGAEALRQELHNLKTVERPNVIAAIAEARAWTNFEILEALTEKEERRWARIGRQRSDK